MRKKLYSLVLMAVGLLISGNVGATIYEVATFSELSAALEEASSGDEIKLTEDITATSSLTLNGITLNLGGHILSNSNQYTWIQTYGNVTIKGNDDGVTPLGKITHNKAQSTTIEGESGSINLISGTIENKGAYPTVVMMYGASNFIMGENATLVCTPNISNSYTHIYGGGFLFYYNLWRGNICWSSRKHY
mgnify:CR=1 FL=1